MAHVLYSADEGLRCPIAREEVEAAVDAVLAHEGVGRACEVSISVIGSDRIRELNSKWRGIDAPTDVLSFACDDPGDPTVPEGEPVELGDIMLCPEVIVAQAPAFSGDAASEFRLMLVHGMCHLLGYDHVDEEGALEMEAVELDVLRDLAAARGEDPGTVEIGPTTRHTDD